MLATGYMSLKEHGLAPPRSWSWSGWTIPASPGRRFPRGGGCPDFRAGLLIAFTVVCGIGETSEGSARASRGCWGAADAGHRPTWKAESNHLAGDMTSTNHLDGPQRHRGHGEDPLPVGDRHPAGHLARTGEAQHELGLGIDESQLEQLRESRSEIDFEAAAAHEKTLRHDVMHLAAHSGREGPWTRAGSSTCATSYMDIVCNGDLIIFREALELVARKPP